MSSQATTFVRYPAEAVDPAPLGEPLVFPFSKRVAMNRFLKSAMSERLATFHPTDLSARGIPLPELITLYRRWGEGQWGQLLTGNVMIDAGHLEAPGNPIIPVDAAFEGERFEAFKALAAEAKAQGSLILAQVSHPGRQTTIDVQPNPISASNVQLVASAVGKGHGVPRPATAEDIAHVIEGFAHAAEYLEKAGFDGIQLHGAHGYLLAQFLSPTTNQRTDKYGGSLENRMRLILEVAAAIKARVSSSFVLGIKINSVEFQEKGFTPEEALLLCQALEKAEFDYVETSGGTYESGGFVHKKESTRKRENYFIEFSERIHAALSETKVYTTGGFKTVAGMVDTLKSVDGVGIARAATQEPDLPRVLLERRANATYKFAGDEDNLVLRLLGSVMQIQQMGRDQAIVDLSQPEGVKQVISTMMKAKA
ncbi:NADH oxidase [Coniella lustricola]|uniref:NADH oxidase n=1 Tax=Coniella lustricola TaxID=2025994 RepID=A0A2T3A4M4_9PEZI|nr:NADH oxidase [Coniella lustricola]